MYSTLSIQKSSIVPVVDQVESCSNCLELLLESSVLAKCRNGHVYCDKCFQKVVKCEFCSTSTRNPNEGRLTLSCRKLDSPSSDDNQESDSSPPSSSCGSNNAATEITSEVIRCENRMYGCKAKFRSIDFNGLFQHMPRCTFKNEKISTLFCYLFLPNTEQKCLKECYGPDSFLQHIFMDHGVTQADQGCPVSQYISFRVNSTTVLEWENMPRHHYVNSCGLHLLTCVGFDPIDNDNGYLYWWCYAIGGIHKSFTSQYLVNITIRNPVSDVELSWNGPAHWRHSSPAKMIRSGMCLTVSRRSFLGLSNYNFQTGCTEWTLSVSIVPAPTNEQFEQEQDPGMTAEYRGETRFIENARMMLLKYSDSDYVDKHSGDRRSTPAPARLAGSRIDQKPLKRSSRSRSNENNYCPKSPNPGRGHSTKSIKKERYSSSSSESSSTTDSDSDDSRYRSREPQYSKRNHQRRDSGNRDASPRKSSRFSQPKIQSRSMVTSKSKLIHRRQEPLKLVDKDKRTKKTVYCSHLSSKVTARDLETFFQPVAKPSSVRMIACGKSGRFKGIGCVEFHDVESAFQAVGLNGQMLLGEKILIQSCMQSRN